MGPPSLPLNEGLSVWLWTEVSLLHDENRFKDEKASHSHMFFSPEDLEDELSYLVDSVADCNNIYDQKVVLLIFSCGSRSTCCSFLHINLNSKHKDCLPGQRIS